MDKNSWSHFKNNLMVAVTLILVLGYADSAVCAVSFPEYFPLDPASHGLKTFQWTYGNSGTYSSYISGTLTVPYTSGDIECTGIVNQFEFDTFYATNDGEEVKWCADDEYYFSTDQDLTAHPPVWTFSTVDDNMLVDMGAYYFVSHDLTTWGQENYLATLFDIQNVTVLLGEYTDAVIMWFLDEQYQFAELSFDGKATHLGIILPTSTQTEGRSVTDFMIYANGVGMIACGDIDAETGNLLSLAELADVSFSNSMPDLQGEFSRVSFRDPVSPGDTIRAQITVTNTGSTATAFKQTIDLSAYLRPCNAINESQDIPVINLTDLSVSNLRTGRSKKLNVRLNVPAVDDGNYRLVAQIDSGDAVEEVNENNNEAVSNTCFQLGTGQGQSRFVETDYIELSKIYAISKFRSGIGHDYSDDFESCRSMKHYYQPQATVNWGDIAIYSPVDGVISRKFEEWAGTQIWIQSSTHPEYEFIIFHINLNSGLDVDSTVSAGQQLGTHIGSQTMSDIAVLMNSAQGNRLVSYFDVMSDSLFQDYQLRGLTSRDEVIISEEERDSDPLTCDGEEFADGGNLENWVILSD